MNIRYLLLHNKLYPSLVAWVHYLSFYGWGIGTQLSWQVLPQGFSRSCSRDVGWGQSSEDLTGAKRSTSKKTHSHCCWQEDSISCFTGLFTDKDASWHGSWHPQSQKWSRQKEVEDTMSLLAYSNKSHCYSCYIFFIRSKALHPAHTQGQN